MLHFGVVKDGTLEQVKGVTYSLRGFLGPSTWGDKKVESISCLADDSDYYKSFGIKPGNQLYHMVIYLAPGDYHRFHSATDWNINYRRHFPGMLTNL